MNAALKWIPLALGGALALAGCARDGFYDDRNLDYVESAPAPPLVLPDTRDQGRYQSALPMPQSDARTEHPDAPVEPRAPRALSLSSGAGDAYVTTREINDKRWLVVAADVASVWPQLERFVRTSGLHDVRRQPGRGMIATREGTLRLDNAVRQGATEVHCDDQGRPLNSCLDDLKAYLSVRAESDDTLSSLNAQRDDQRRAVKLQREGERWQASIPYSPDRAWAEIHHYLEQDFNQEEKRELLEANPRRHAFLLDYLTQSNRERGMLSAIFLPLANVSSQPISLELRADGDNSVLQAKSDDERELSADDQHELLERIVDYLR
ncbi:MAG: lipoprotein, NlpB [Halomonas subglaciescola]|nr:lipoprotein, NlpB [Halomonas subglaciescola]